MFIKVLAAKTLEAKANSRGNAGVSGGGPHQRLPETPSSREAVTQDGSPGQATPACHSRSEGSPAASEEQQGRGALRGREAAGGSPQPPACHSHAGPASPPPPHPPQTNRELLVRVWRGPSGRGNCESKGGPAGWDPGIPILLLYRPQATCTCTPAALHPRHKPTRSGWNCAAPPPPPQTCLSPTPAPGNGNYRETESDEIKFR